MQSLPTDTVPAAEFILRHMYRPLDLAEGRFFAVPETADPIGGDVWFWSDDNAKILEFLSRPELWRRFPRETGEILRFVQAMCDRSFIFRRVSQPRLDPTAKEGNISGYCHSLMQLKYELERGAVVAGVRFHDERNADHLMLSGNYIEFTYRGRRFRRVIERAIDQVDAAQDGHKLSLRHSSEMNFTSLWQPRRLGRISYTYTFDARSMLFEVEAALDLDPRIQVSDVVLTIGHAGLGYCFYNNIIADSSPGAMPLFRARKPAVGVVEAAGGTYYAIRQAHISSDSLAIHSMPREPERFRGLETVVETIGQLSRVHAQYRFPGPQRGARLIAAEHKLITAGGFYDRIADYAGFMRDAIVATAAPQCARDLSISYDYGATINAFAKCFAVCAAGDIAPEPASLTEELRSLVDRYLDYYVELYVDRHQQRPNVIFSRELAFVVLGVATMCRATGSPDYLRRLRQLCEVILDFEWRFDDLAGEPASTFLMRKDSAGPSCLDCHGSALLALTQAARFISDPRLSAAIERGLAAYCLETCSGGDGMLYKLDTISTVAVDRRGNRHSDNAFWNFKAGLTLRLLTALQTSPCPEVQAIFSRHSDRIGLFTLILQRQMARSITRRGDTLAIRTSRFAAETNSETQPWVMLGLFGHPCD
jgi:hypothetical protein